MAPYKKACTQSVYTVEGLLSLLLKLLLNYFMLAFLKVTVNSKLSQSKEEKIKVEII